MDGKINCDKGRAPGFAKSIFYSFYCSSRQYGWTPLNAASEQGHEAVVQLLVESKAAVGAANDVSALLFVEER